jgi:hypothetical protein
MSERAGATVSAARITVLLAVTLLGTAPAAAQVGGRGEVEAGVRLFVQPAPSDALVVLTPLVAGVVNAKPWLRFDVSWIADVVTGATPRAYGRPDVVTAATPFNEVRNVLGAGAAVVAGPATIGAGYSFGIENDYRSHLVRAGVRLDLLRHDTVIAANYAYSFNQICNLDEGNLPVTLRQPLDSARGCFAGVPGLTEERLDTHGLEVSLVQTLTPKLVLALIGGYQHLSGFQSNPYRRVILFEGLFQPQESHPLVRDRGSLTGRLRIAIARVRATLGLELRLYRDTWGIESLTAEANWEQPLRRQSRWSFAARARGYLQSRAAFYRDAGEPDSYERAGPVGNFFTADQELAPLADLLLGGRFIYTASRPADRRYLHAFTGLQTTLLFEYLRIFALSPDPPNVDRTRGFASALVFAASLTGQF